MSIADKITRLQTAKSNIATAITDKGGSVSAGDGFESFSADIATIPQGGGGAVVEKDVNFIDFDGTLRYSYSYTQALALTALPDGPDHTSGADTDGVPLTFDGWNWTLQDIFDSLDARPDTPITVGALYRTTDNYGHFITEYLPPNGVVHFTQIGAGPRNRVIVDWGDGSAEETWNNSADHTHNYVNGGVYNIKINYIDNEITRITSYRNNSSVYNDIKAMYFPRTESTSVTYTEFLSNISAIKITLPAYSSLGSNNSFIRDSYRLKALVVPRILVNFFLASCPSLQKVSYPRLVGGSTMSQGSYGSSYVAFPQGNIKVENIGEDTGSMFIQTLDLPSTTNSISSLINHLYSLATIRSWATTPPSLGGFGFIGINEQVIKIIVPPGTKSLYENASNWSLLAGKFVEDLVVTSCSSLSITADDIGAGNDTTTTIHATAVINGTSLSGRKTYTNYTLNFNVAKNDVPQNTTSEAITRTITLTWNGQTASTTITHGKWYDRTRSVDDSVWTNSTYWSNPDPTNYDYYMSQQSTTYSSQYLAITISGYNRYSIKIGGYTNVKMGSIPTSSSYDFRVNTAIWGSSSTDVICSWNNLDPEQSYTIYVAHTYNNTNYYYSANVLIPKVPS